MEIIKSLSEINEHEVYEAFAEAFADYELQLIESQLMAMLSRRGWAPELSFGAFNQGRLLSFTLNGIASALLLHALKFNQNDAVKCINTEISSESITRFLQSNGITLKGKQFEMIKQL